MKTSRRKTVACIVRYTSSLSLSRPPSLALSLSKSIRAISLSLPLPTLITRVPSLLGISLLFVCPSTFSEALPPPTPPPPNTHSILCQLPLSPSRTSTHKHRDMLCLIFCSIALPTVSSFARQVLPNLNQTRTSLNSPISQPFYGTPKQSITQPWCVVRAMR